MGSSPTRGSSFFLGKVTALGVLCCFALFVCLILLASFFLPSHVSVMLKNIAQYSDSADSAVGIREGGQERPTCIHEHVHMYHLAGARHDALYAYC